jgi:putative DNA methylase
MAFNEGEYGVAEQLATSKNTSVSGLADAGIRRSKAGKVRLLKPAEFPADWDPTADKRPHRLGDGAPTDPRARIRRRHAAAALVAKLGSESETARELCYRLYTLCERKKRANEAMAYNALVQSWPEIARLARETGSTAPPGDRGSVRCRSSIKQPIAEGEEPCTLP